MAPAKKRKVSSSSAANTLWSYFAPGAQSHASAPVKKAKREATPSFLPETSNGLVGTGSKGSPIVLAADEDEENGMQVFEGDPPLAGDESASTVSGDGTSETIVDVLPPRDCTPPPDSNVVGDPGPSTLSYRETSSGRSLEDSQQAYGADDDNYWIMGDDEVVPSAEEGDKNDDIEGFDDDVAEGTVNGHAETASCFKQEDDTGLACPLCGLRIDDLDKLERHANACLDSPPQVNHSTKSSTKGPKRVVAPLKSLSDLCSPFTTPVETKPASNPSAFSVLMSQNKESLAWESAEADEQRGQRPAGSGRRKAPFYKVLQGMPIAVDAFRYGKIPGVRAYFLTHAHSDHYTNLSSSWKHGPIYCSETTANLIKMNLNVPNEYVHPLPLDVSTVIPDTGDVTVTLIEANHCPGSVLFLFVGRQTVHAGDSPVVSPFIGSKRLFRYLHCGDFRACPRHALSEGVNGKKLDLVYLDTTYLNPKYCFPPQRQVIDACVSLSRRIVLGEQVKSESADTKPTGFIQNMISGWLKPKEEEETDVKVEEGLEGETKSKERVLVAIGTYSIGKERIVKAIAQSLDSKVYCDPRKKAILLAQDDPELHAMLSSDPFTSQVHLLPLQNISVERMQEYLEQFQGKFTRVLGFRPTGWTYTPPAGTDTMPDVNRVILRDQRRIFDETGLKPMRGSSMQYMLYGVPYSEHSSFFELTCFAVSVDVAKIIATVNVGSASSRGKMNKWFEKWEAERKRRRNAGTDAIVKYRHVDYW